MALACPVGSIYPYRTIAALEFLEKRFENPHESLVRIETQPSLRSGVDALLGHDRLVVGLGLEKLFVERCHYRTP